MNGRLQLALAASIKRRGTAIVLRVITQTGVPVLPNPPTLVNPVTAAALTAGATALAINASQAYGRILLDDQFTIAGQLVTVLAPVASRPNVAGGAGFDNVTFSPALTADVAAGTALVPTWSADINTWAMISSFPSNVVDGDLIQLSDVRLVIPALDGFDPKLNWKVFVNGLERTILNMDPKYDRNVIVSYWCQAR